MNMDQITYKQLVKKYGKGFSALEKALSSIPKKAWSFKPTPEEWSISEIIVHLVDSEANAMLRIRVLFAEEGRTLMAYDQDIWASKLNYLNTDLDSSMFLLEGIRKFTHSWLKSIAVSDFQNYAIHPEYGEPYSFEKWMVIYSNHIYSHIDQVNKNYTLWKSQRTQKTKNK